MERTTATTIFESLASGVRLDVFRLLVKKGTEGLVAGEIASALDIPPTNLSFHLKAMTHAGLVNVTAEGRFQRYRANLVLMVDLITYLTEECCAGQPGQCGDFPPVASARNACESLYNTPKAPNAKHPDF